MTYVTRQIQLTVSENQNGENQVIKRGDRPIKFEDVDTLHEAEFKKYIVSAPVVDKDLLEGTTIAIGKILYVETDIELTMKLQLVGDTGIVVKPIVDADASTKPGTLYLEGDFTHVYISIGGTIAANVIMGVVGA